MKWNQVREWHLIPSIQNIAIVKTRRVFVIRYLYIGIFLCLNVPERNKFYILLVKAND